jgi:flagellar hook assembly protein FlgD
LDEKITFRYDTNDKDENVTIRVFDFGMNYVRTVIQNAPRKLSASDPPVDNWDGKDDSGNVVADGVYFYRVEVGSSDPLFGKIILIK